ncbi:MAG: DUF5004 domain-containing protein [Prevotella sp.]|nr:DUF5004 domain-containing protein [Prevotella sp.]
MTKKSTLKALLLLLALSPSMWLTSCSTIEDGDYVAPITQYEKMEGKWKVNSVTQIDETNQKQMSLTSLFDFESFTINLGMDASGNPTTYAIDGNAPALLPVSGQWKLQNPFVNSDGSAARLMLNENTSLTVTAMPGAQQALEFKLTRTQNGNAFVSYVYNLVPAE